MNIIRIVFYIFSFVFPITALSDHHGVSGLVSDEMIEEQREALQRNAVSAGFGPQSPRDIDSTAGSNPRVFSFAPEFEDMNLCNIHFHKNAEHKGGEYTKYAGNGDGKGNQTGYLYSGQLSASELTPVSNNICPSEQGGLLAGDTIEVHYVFSSANVEPGPTLGACLSDETMNPQLRVEAQVMVLVNDVSALDFHDLTEIGLVENYHQALNIPDNTGTPVQYVGSTTGPAYNEEGSPLQVSWSVRPEIAKVDINTVGDWCESNPFDESQAHGVRNLVINPLLLSEID
jgi:hypothetical protein